MNFEQSWRPSAEIEVLKHRSAIITKIRDFFVQRHYLEVETPIMARYGVTDVYLSNIQAFFRKEAYQLQTSPEYHMKRLLAAGSGPIFQLARVFRDDELGRWHNPEFTLLEWYQLDIDHHELMDEMDLFLQTILKSEPLIRKTYEQAFIESCSIDPFTASIEQLKSVLKKYELDKVLPAEEMDIDQYLFLLMSHVVEPFLAYEGAPVAVYDFPESQAALAQVHKGVAHRFEVYFKGVELANGFHELTDVQAQANRFARDQKSRIEKGLLEVDADRYLLDALEFGMPSCSGVALGIDRLLALALNKDSIKDVISFDFSRA
ncbi:elongation factor P--(R)-beta-lysine ligase [Legionella waltersii]|uniref:Lysyl-tRNA synthetase, class II n=1 Tax=Legionella waltersii TaxID=66969 RepID=A0A0W1ADD9_9GAMM|nr:elongation factor P--(R)-beta-lysine ligase [Legionella waltersii]KTD79357.1 lysyl-tRNA synthetase, class II [Legionella waltersii]SNU99878.1 lysyl-tRNA synthetase, class II [Legionella waltersii]